MAIKYRHRQEIKKNGSTNVNHQQKEKNTQAENEIKQVENRNKCK